MEKLYEYQNGGYLIKIFNDGTKEIIGEGIPEYPISMDIKITNYCDAGCAWCHEKSDTQGKHGDILKYIPMLSDLPQGTELAIGGGNPLSHPDLIEFLGGLRSIGMIPNITVNSFHLKKFNNTIKDFVIHNLIYGLGISYNPINKKEILDFQYSNMVVHMIAGVHTFEQIKEMLEGGKKVLILGYKQWGRGNDFYNDKIQNNIKEIYQKLNQLFGIGLISFDNLAIKQLNPKRFFIQETWDKRFMGEDGSFTMYMDFVKGEYALNSFAEKRYSIEGSMKEIFNNIYNLNN